MAGFVGSIKKLFCVFIWEDIIKRRSDQFFGNLDHFHPIEIVDSGDYNFQVVENCNLILEYIDLNYFNPYPVKLFYLNSHSLEDVSRYRDQQLQVSEYYSYLFNLSTNIWKYWCLDTHFILKNSELVD